MTTILKLRVDFHNSDVLGRVRINTKSALETLGNSSTPLVAGSKIFLYDGEDLSADGILEFSKEEGIWVGIINRDDLGK